MKKYKRVYLTEKSSQVVALAEVENAAMSGNRAYNNEKRIAIVPLQGHALINEDTKKYAEEFDKFVEDSLHKFPQRLRLRPNPYIKEKYNAAIEHLKDAEEIVIATDFDEEGAAIAMNIIEKAGVSDRVAFMLEMGSTHPKELRKYIDNPTDIPYINLAESARARAWIDFVEGMYYSRALSYYLGNNYAVKLNYGGVKSPLTYIVVERDLANKNHIKSYFYTSCGEAEFNGSKFKICLEKKIEDEVNGKKKISWTSDFDSEDEIKEALSLFNSKKIKINRISRTEKNTIPPKLCDLGTVQVEMSTKFKINPSKTMELAQKNYDQPVSIETYPRTEIPYLKSSEYDDVPIILNKLRGIIQEDIIDDILSGKKIPKRKSTFNDKEVVAHGAIVPSKEGDFDNWLKKLPKENVYLFEFVSKRYVANFMEDYIYENISGVSDEINNYRLSFSENIPKKAGWKKVFDKNIENDILNYKQDIPNDLSTGDLINVNSLTIDKKETKPKPLFTMASLLKAMRNVASLFPDNEKIKKHLKEGGLGTPATRDKIINEVMDKEKNGGEPWLIEKSNKVLSTDKAKNYISNMPIELVSPIKRAILSEKLKMISRGELSYDDLINEYREDIANNIELIKKITKEKGPLKGADKTKNISLGKCPVCTTGDIIERKKAYICSNAKYKKNDDGSFVNDGCKYMILKQGLSRFGKNNISPNEITKLLKDGKVKVSLKSKGTGKAYSKFIKVNNQFGIEVDFNTNIK